MKRKFHHFLLFLLLVNFSWAYGISSHVEHKRYSRNAVKAGPSVTIDEITPGPCTLIVEWTCSTSDLDGFNITWQQTGKDKESAPSLQSSKSQSYTIQALNSDQAYTVWVTAVVDGEESFSDSDQQSTTEGEPMEVTGVKADQVTDSVIHISWAESSNVCPIQGYQVTWKGTSKSDGTIKPQGNLETDEIEVDVDNLTPYTDYDFYVSEITTDGLVGDPSEPASADTKEGAASPPEPVNSVTLGPYSAQVNWSSPETPNGKISGYHVSCQLSPDSEDDCDVTVGDNVFTTTIGEGLKACGDYTFSVQAINGFGNGESGTHASRTDSEPPPHFTSITIDNITSTSAVIFWDPLATNCPVTKYRIIVQESVLWKDQTDSFTKSYSGENNEYLLEDLTPYSDYDISIQATTEGGTTKVEDSDKQQFQTLQGVPEAPAFINSSTTGTSSVLLYWESSTAINGEFDHYHIVCSKAGKLHDCDETVTSKATEIFWEATGLDACGDYTFKVTAVNELEEGDEATSDSTTDSEPPGILEEVESTSPTSTNMTIKFEPPDTTCEILRYDIEGTGTYQWNNESYTYKGTLVESDGTYIVPDLIPFTYYTFNMSATTDGGTTNGVMFEDQTDKDAPSAPRNVKAIATDSSHIKVTWDEPEYVNGRSIRSYYLTYGLFSGSESDAIKVSTGRQYTIGDKLAEVLLPCRTYHISVRAANEIDNGTAKSVPATLDGEAPDAVKHLNCTTSGANQIDLTWNVQRISCGVETYEIFLEGDILWGGDKNQTITVPNKLPGIESYTIDGLTPCTSYNITLTPSNDAGSGEPESCICVTEEARPDAPTNMKMLDITKSKLEIQWDAPENKNGFLTRFKITWDTNEEGIHVDADNDTTTYSYAIEDLDDGIMYTINLYAENSAGLSAPASFPAETDKSHLGAILGTVIPVIVIIIAVIAGVWYNHHSKKKKKNKSNSDD